MISVTGVLNGKGNVNVILQENNKINDLKKDRIRFENFRASTSPLFANSNTSVKSENLNDCIKEKFPIKRYHASPSSLFANAPVISDLTETAFLNLSFENYSGKPFYHIREVWNGAAFV